MPLDKKPASSPALNPHAPNPYAKAAGAYGSSALKLTPDQRELEGRVLIKAANAFKDIQGKWESLSPGALEDALKYNRHVWMMFYDTALDNSEGERPRDLRSNIVNLANFIFKREIEILAAPKKEKLDVLININLEIAAGLMTKSGDAGAEAR